MKVLHFMVCKQPRAHKRACTLCVLMSCNSLKYILSTVRLCEQQRNKQTTNTTLTLSGLSNDHSHLVLFKDSLVYLLVNASLLPAVQDH